MGIPQEVGEVAFCSVGLKLLKANKNAPETRPWSRKGPDPGVVVVEGPAHADSPEAS